ncbi:MULTISPECIES: type VI secretion system baseplate subunit TssF [unclassified Chelatococcus]|uniref:type VI secretion system baseplate subunit TssF n=1 Tax=unclassified Chelatococcus TaxID=2638111 RepID=UPI001BCF7AEF|nr:MULTISPECIES: type VI secretion system baseplate subunit TssF [unclassified Chelatococcus]CAH1653446.1 Protein ImpG/VasA [Hyphomicrobiales bacterium]MBS7740120.1 type VI secretion system baseplate subunit TssF [Chelatococcus sp. HY11]MBX3545051.1 type VI secretion system baseplate subunit TssF [Chelatococcus sp.]MCO5078580.1 type VI secretion system baseplate subunit TssF [Chelatococcus sp.]CAH1685700.1 Protein ImpG/VasA [Hyphomicrobiales bacterium]
MTNDFLRAYSDELAHLRQAGQRFAAAHPDIAGRLRFSAEQTDDPFVAHLMEAFAFLTARLRQKLDDDLPELTDPLLERLYPHLTAPVPSTAIVQFKPRPDLTAPYHIPAGETVESEPVDGQRCRFQTVYPVVLWPQTLVSADLGGYGQAAGAMPPACGARGMLRLTFAPLAGAAAPTAWPHSLRLFLCGTPQEARRLYALLNREIVAVGFRPRRPGSPPEGEVMRFADPDCVSPAGLTADEGLMPYGRQSQLGYRLLSEYFACPDKFMFLDIAFPAALAGQMAEPDMAGIEISLHLRQWPAAIERQLSAESFALGCTPVINLFSHSAEPLRIVHGMGDHRVLPDARRPEAFEMYRVDTVEIIRRDGKVERCAQLFSAPEREGLFWQAHRRANFGGDASEIVLSLVDGERRPLDLMGSTLAVSGLCSNGDLPARLPFGGGRPHLMLAAGAPVETVTCLTPPAQVLRRRGDAGSHRRLISHLVLNHLSLSGDDDALVALKEILALHDLRCTAESGAAIAALRGLAAKPAVARAPGGHGALCRGLDLVATCDTARIDSGEAFLLATVLERFLALHCGINAFTRLSLAGHGGEIVKTWPARAGERIIL